MVPLLFQNLLLQVWHLCQTGGQTVVPWHTVVLTIPILCSVHICAVWETHQLVLWHLHHL